MRIILLSLFTASAVYLKFPLMRISFVMPQFAHVRRVTVTDDQLLQFALAYRLEMESGALCESGLAQALNTLPSSALPETRQALRKRTGVVESLHRDSHEYPLLRDLSLAVALSQKQGSQLGTSLKVLTDSIRDRIEIQQVLRSELASVKATIVVLAALPFLGIGFATLLGAHPFRWLMTSNIGHVCVSLAIILEITGVLWTQSLVSRALKEPA